MILFLIYCRNYFPIGPFSYLTLFAMFILLNILRNCLSFLLLLLMEPLMAYLALCSLSSWMHTFTRALRFPSIIILYILPNKPLPNLQILYFWLWVIMDWALISFLRWNTHCLVEYIMYKCRSNSVVSLTQIYYFLLPNVLPTFLHLIMTFDILPKAGYSFCIWQISTVCSLYVSQQF